MTCTGMSGSGARTGMATYPGGIAVDPQGPATGSIPRGSRRLLASTAAARLPVSVPRHRLPGLQDRLRRFPGCARPRSALKGNGQAKRLKTQEKANTLTTKRTPMKTKLITRIAGVSPADNRNRCSCVRENAADSSQPPTHVGGHNRITATVFLVAASCLCLLPSGDRRSRVLDTKGGHARPSEHPSLVRGGRNPLRDGRPLSIPNRPQDRLGLRSANGLVDTQS